MHILYKDIYSVVPLERGQYPHNYSQTTLIACQLMDRAADWYFATVGVIIDVKSINNAPRYSDT